MSADNLNAFWGETFVPQTTKRYKVDDVRFEGYCRNALLSSNQKSHLKKDVLARCQVHATDIYLNEDLVGGQELECAEINNMEIFRGRSSCCENEPDYVSGDTICKMGDNAEMDMRDCEIEWKSLTICEKIGEGTSTTFLSTLLLYPCIQTLPILTFVVLSMM